MAERQQDARAPEAGAAAIPPAETGLAAEMTRLFIQHAPDAVIVVDDAGSIIFANQQAEQAFAYTQAELLGMRIEQLLPERLRPQHASHRAHFAALPRLRPMGMGLELFARRRDGSEFPVEISLSPLQTAAGLCVVAIIRDLTERRQLEAALHAAQREAEQVKDDFIAIAAHELRNPLTALSGFTEMLQVQTARGHGPALGEWQLEAIAAIDQATQRLTALTDDLLDVTRLQAGKLTLHLARHDLVALVRRVVARQAATTQRHSLTLVAHQAPLVVRVDPLRFEQVLTNLVHNAIKYSPDGGPVTVAIVPEGDAVRLSITDAGIGIPVADHEQLFTRFGRATNARAIGGTGLGLYLCRELVERHQGHIGFTSAEGQGATFWVVLPLVDAHDDAAATQEE